jgi:transposase-like protein
VPRPDFPRSIVEFQRRFPDDAACLEYLAASRWPDGYRCPACGGKRAWVLTRRHLWQCAACGHQASVRAGTVLHRTRLPLSLWFWAAYLVSTHTPGISALQLRRQLGIGRYETAWMMLHKLRRGMVAREREPLKHEVEVDEFFLGGYEQGLRGGRQRGSKALVAAAVEVRGEGSGRLRLRVAPDASAETLGGFVSAAVAPGAIVHTDGWAGYADLPERGYAHRPRSQRAHPDEHLLPRVHRAISNLKSWLRGTHRGVSPDHLQVYLDEYVFRFNRRGTPMAAFQTLLGLGADHQPTTYREILTRLSEPDKH